MSKFRLSRWDRFTMALAPKWTLNRVRARMVTSELERHYEAAQVGRRTTGWARNRGDAAAVGTSAIVELRMHARDLIRNNAWAKKAQRVVANNTVGAGIIPKAIGAEAAKAAELWKAWAGTTECESEGRHTFYGIQNLAMKSLMESGEILIRRRYRRTTDGLTVPIQLQVLEADFLDSTRNYVATDTRGPTIQGVEYDLLGRRQAYWLFRVHPGSLFAVGVAERVPAADVIHVFYTERPGQVRGVSWFGASIVNLKDFDEYEDATLMKQKIAACFAAFVTDMDGMGAPLGEDPGTTEPGDQLEPGMIEYLGPGKDVKFASPPAVSEHQSFTKTNLMKVASGLLVTPEDLTSDYSQMNFSSARASRLAHYQNVEDWRYHMLIPLLCDGVWAWFTQAAIAQGAIKVAPSAGWTCPPMPMIEPDKEGLALQRLVRTGAKTPSEMVREQGEDPDEHWAEYAADMQKLDALGITLDVDVRKVSQVGQDQVAPAAPASADPKAAKRDEELEEMTMGLVRSVTGAGHE